MKRMAGWNKNLCLRVVCIFILANLIQRTDGGTHAEELQLVTDLLNGYSTQVIPRNDTNFPLTVYFTFSPISLANFDVVNEVLEIVSFLTVSWQDQKIQWTPASYGDIATTTISQKLLWKPDVALRNSIEDYKVVGNDAMFLLLYSTGWVYWYPYQRFFSSCSVDVTYFPFDVQHCYLQFSAWSYSTDEVIIAAATPPMDLTLFEHHPLWEVADTYQSGENKTSVSSIKFHLTLKRKPLSFILSVIAPTILLSILNLFSFVLPCESGERAGYSITVFLSFVVFFTIVTSMLPGNSDSTPIVGNYILAQTIMSTLITAVSLTLMRLYFCFDDVEVPAILLKMAKILRLKPCRKGCGLCCARSKIQAFDEDKSVDGHVSKEPTKLDMQLADEKEEHDKAKHTWKYMVNSLDILMFYFVLAVLIISTIVCFTMAMNGPDV